MDRGDGVEDKMRFDAAVLYYDKHRSTYVKELFDDLFSYANCDKDSLAVEVGCGTGQATAWVLQTGCTVKAVEIGGNLCEFTRQKFKGYPNLDVINMPFERYDMRENSLDLVYSASAFHWIPEDVGYPKIYNALKKGGCFAIFGCPVEIAGSNKELKDKIEAWENDCFPKDMRTNESEYAAARRNYERYGFRDFTHKQYSAYRDFTADAYIELLLSV